MAIHTHQNNPHIHIVLNKRNILTKRKFILIQKMILKIFGMMLEVIFLCL